MLKKYTCGSGTIKTKKGFVYVLCRYVRTYRYIYSSRLIYTYSYNIYHTSIMCAESRHMLEESPEVSGSNCQVVPDFHFPIFRCPWHCILHRCAGSTSILCFRVDSTSLVASTRYFTSCCFVPTNHIVRHLVNYRSHPTLCTKYRYLMIDLICY